MRFLALLSSLFLLTTGAHAQGPTSTQTLEAGKSAYYLQLTPESSASSFVPSSAQLSWTPAEKATAVNGLFISAYIHTSKTEDNILELFNPSIQDVSTAGYSIRIAQAFATSTKDTKLRTWESGTINYDLPSTGLIKAGSSYVICHTSNTDVRCDHRPKSSNGKKPATFVFRGNDALALYFGGATLVDEIGDISKAMKTPLINGFPVTGTQYTTYQTTLYRINTVYKGTTWADSLVKGEWRGAASGDTSELKKHPYTTWPAIKPSVLQVKDEVTTLALSTSAVIATASTYITTASVYIPDTAKIQDLKFKVAGVNAYNGDSEVYGDVSLTRAQQEKARNSWQTITIHASRDIPASTRLNIRITVPGGIMEPASGYLFDSVVIYQSTLPAPVHAAASVIVTPPSTPTTPPTNVKSTLSIVEPLSNAKDVSLTPTIRFKVSNPPAKTIALNYRFKLNTDEYIVKSIPADKYNTAGDEITMDFDLLLSASTSYRLILDVVNAATNTPITDSLERSFITIGNGELKAPKEILIKALTNAATLSWSDSNSAGDYQVEIRTQNDDGSFGTWSNAIGSGGVGVLTQKDRSFTLELTKLIAATSYHIALRVSTSPSTSTAWVAVAFRTDGFIRRPGSLLTREEKLEYTRALKAISYTNQYQVLTLQHDVALNTPNRAHRGPIFAPWHREFLLRLEKALKEATNPDIYAPHYGITFWDWDRAATTEKEFQSVFTDDFMGGDGNITTGVVQTGPFATCIGNPDPKCDPNMDWDPVEESGLQSKPFDTTLKTRTGLTRGFGQSGVSWTNIAKRSAIDTYMASPRTYLEFNSQLESWHNNVHVYVGGDMLSGTSPNDPVFYQHHCNVDKLWWEFQMKQPNVLYDPDRTATKIPRGYTKEQRFDSLMQFQDDAPELNQVPISKMMDGNAMGTRYVMTWKPEWSKPVRLNGPINVPDVATPAWTISTGTLTGKTFETATITTKLAVTYQAYTDLTLTVQVSNPSDLVIVSFLNAAGEILALGSAGKTAGTITVPLNIESSHRSLGEAITISIEAKGAVTITSVALNAVAKTVKFQQGLALATPGGGAKTSEWTARVSSEEGATDLIAPGGTVTTTSITVATLIGVIVGGVVLLIITAIAAFVMGSRRATAVGNNKVKMFAAQETQDTNSIWQQNPAIAMSQV